MNDSTYLNEPVWRATVLPGEVQALYDAGNAAIDPSPDVLVVGGGIVGAAVAYYLADGGARVQLIDAGELAGDATGTGAGGIWPADQGPFHPSGFRDLALASRDLWGRLSLTPGFEFEWRVRGFLNVNAARFGNDAMGFASRAQEAGYTVHAVGAAQISRLEPALADGLACAIHCPSDAHLNPLKAAYSLSAEARRKGALVAPFTRVQCMTRERNCIARVETDRGSIAPRAVVMATGWRTEAWRDLSVRPPPLRPVAGQLIATDPVPPLLNGAVAGDYLVLQLASGQVVTGGNLVEGSATAPDPAASARFASAARALLPALAGVPFVRAWCGLRSATPDCLPVIDRLPGLNNAWLAAGHYRNGLLLAPATGKFLAEWIMSGQRPGILEPFGCARFK
jgi:glycine/D-amino acid oxidase-like deaminating enzyme